MQVNHNDLDSDREAMMISPKNITLRNVTIGASNNGKPWVTGPHRITLDKIRVQ